MRTLAEREGTGAATARTRSRSRNKDKEDEERDGDAVETTFWADVDELRAFYADDRINSENVTRWSNNRQGGRGKKNLERRGKVLRYDKVSAAVQRGLDASRAKEWNKWKQFNAADVISVEEADQYIANGAEQLGTQWVETDKNAHKRRDGKYVEPLLKSRLVGCGNFENAKGLRTDSPAGDVDAHNLIFSWCAANKVPIKMAGISNAYLLSLIHI